MEKHKKIKKYLTLADMKIECFKRPGVKKAYDDLQFEFQIIRALIEARARKKMTQKELAQKIGVAQSALARFESGNINPTLSFLKKVTSGLGLQLLVR